MEFDQLLLKAVPRAAVHLPEGNPFRGGCRGIERDRAGHERKFEKAIPVSTRQRRLQCEHDDTPESGRRIQGVNGAPKGRVPPGKEVPSSKNKGITRRGAGGLVTLSWRGEPPEPTAATDARGES